MSDTDDETRNELFEEFLEESDEMISEMEEHSIELEANPGQMEPIHGIFRCAHSLKGNSAFFGFSQIQGFCHDFESFLDLVRDKVIEIDGKMVSFILEGADLMKGLIGRLRGEGGAVTLTPEEKNYLDQIADKVAIHSEEGNLEILKSELIKIFNKSHEDGSFEEDSHIKDIYDVMMKYAPDLVIDRRSMDRDDASQWIYETLDVTREYNDLRHLVAGEGSGSSTNEYEAFLDSIDSLISKHVSAGLDKDLHILEDIKDNFEIFYQDEIGFDEILCNTVSESLDEYATALQEIKPEKEEEKTGAVVKDGAKKSKGKKITKVKTIRIPEILLDDLIDQVGELITTNELFSIIQRKMERNEIDGLSLDLKNTNQTFSDISTQLQRILYEVRKVPFDRALGKLPAIVRGIAKNSGKIITFTSSGGATELDKSLLDKVETVLVHCIRNSADHGIEMPEERLASGKSANGKISVDVSARDNRLFVSVVDDGRGVDLAQVGVKAVEKGICLLEEIEKMSNMELLNLLVVPGFSTAEAVTETSGRGVGMDVLASSIRDMGGKLNLSNNPGKGFRIDMTLPIAYTTIIKLGLTLRVGSEIFLVPAENVRESFKVTESDYGTFEGRGEVVKRWGKIYPLMKLCKIFDIKPRHNNVWDAICVLVESKGKTVCLQVDEMIGQRQIVYKQLNLKTVEPSAFEGISILDGRNMALILSVDGIIKQYRG